MNEYGIKLALKKRDYDIQKEELDKEEDKYNQIMKTLSKLKDQ